MPFLRMPSACSSTTRGRVKFPNLTPAAATGIYKWGAAVVSEGKIYAIPSNAECILVYDTRKANTFLVDTTGVTTGSDKWLAAVASEGMIYAIPSHAERMLVYDTRKGEIFQVDTTVAATGVYKWGAAVVSEGKDQV